MGKEVKLSVNFNFFLPDDDDEMLISQVSENFSKIDTLLKALKTEKADIKSPTFTGTPTATTANINDSSSRIATTEFVRNACTPYEIITSKMVPIDDKLSYEGDYIQIPVDLNSGWYIFTVKYCSGYNIIHNEATFYDFVKGTEIYPVEGEKIAGYIDTTAYAMYVLSDTITWDEFLVAFLTDKKKNNKNFFADEPFMSVKKLESLSEIVTKDMPQQYYVSKELSQNMPTNGPYIVTIIHTNIYVDTIAPHWTLQANSFSSGKRYSATLYDSKGINGVVNTPFNYAVEWAEI